MSPQLDWHDNCKAANSKLINAQCLLEQQWQLSQWPQAHNSEIPWLVWQWLSYCFQLLNAGQLLRQQKVHCFKISQCREIFEVTASPSSEISWLEQQQQDQLLQNCLGNNGNCWNDHESIALKLLYWHGNGKAAASKLLNAAWLSGDSMALKSLDWCGNCKAAASNCLIEVNYCDNSKPTASKYLNATKSLSWLWAHSSEITWLMWQGQDCCIKIIQQTVIIGATAEIVEMTMSPQLWNHLIGVTIAMLVLQNYSRQGNCWGNSKPKLWNLYMQGNC